MDGKKIIESALKSARDLNLDKEAISELKTIAQSNNNDEIAEIKQQAAKGGGLKFEAYLPWVA